MTRPGRERPAPSGPLRYALSGREQVQGWLELEDALLLCGLDEAQKASGVTGDIMEIGAYKGRTSILLGFFPSVGEALMVCDPFEEPVQAAANRTENDRHYGGLSQQEFLANYRRFHGFDPMVLAHESSGLLQREDLAGRFRLVHVDGSHRYEAVVSDIETSRRLLRRGGVVVFDDAVNRKEVAVAAAVWEAVFTRGLKPFASTGKLYGSWDGAMTADDVSRIVGEQANLVVDKEVDIAGHRVPFIRALPMKRPLTTAIRQDLVPPLFRKAATRLRSASGSWAGESELPRVGNGPWRQK